MLKLLWCPLMLLKKAQMLADKDSFGCKLDPVPFITWAGTIYGPHKTRNEDFICMVERIDNPKKK